MINLHNSGGRGCPVSLGGSPSVRVVLHVVLKASRICTNVMLWLWLGSLANIILNIFQDILRQSGGGSK